MQSEVYKYAMTAHFKNRMEKRIGINVTKGQRSDIINSLHGGGPYKSSFAGRTGDAHRSWYLVSLEGVNIYVLYDKKYNKLVTCLSYEDRPIESLKDELRNCTKQLEAAQLGIDKIKAHIVELQAEIKEREGNK